ncbi:MAG: DoxX family protein, partial [Gemmatimonadota bacterium]
MKEVEGVDLIRRAVLVPLRLYLAVVFLVAVRPKLTAEGGFQPGLEGFVRNLGLESAHGFYRPVLESLVLPNSGVFTAIIMTAELLIGLALLTGAATRLAAGVAMFLVLNYMLTKGAWFWTPSSNDAAFFFIGLTLILGAAGRVWGLDRRLHEKYPGVPL